MNARGRRLILIPMGMMLLLFGGVSLLAEEQPPAKSCCTAKATSAEQTAAGKACCAAPGAKMAQAAPAKQACCAAPAEPMVQAAASEEKSCCAAPTETKDANYVRTLAQYQVPDVTLVTQEGERVSLSQLLDTDRPVLLDFVFTTCTTICPVLTAGFADLQRQLGPQAEDVLMVSVSIDPEHDTPEVMLEYLQRFEAGPNWTFLTGNRADIEKTMRAFDAYVANKMSHLPLTFLKAPGAEKWVRIHGLISTADFMKEFQQLAQN